MSEIILSVEAYCKIILHAIKYPHCSVNGVLLAKIPTNNEIEFVDAIPLFHLGLNLSPMTEIALMQIDAVASKKNLTIAGYYSASEILQEVSFEKSHNRIIDKIAAYCRNTYVFMVNNNKLSNYLDNIALKVAQYSDGNYKVCDVHRICFKSDRALDVCSTLIQKKSYNDLIDFDNHLDDIKLDWKNPNLKQQINELL